MILLALLATAATFQETAAIDRAVAQFTGRPVGAEGGAATPVDPRLKLAACATAALTWRTEARDAVVVRCQGPEWRIFVPVRMPPQAALVPPVAASAPMAAAPVARLAVIHRGDPVTIEAGSAGFSITREGIALADAAVGARFLVKVDDARAPVQAISVEAGRATLPGW